MELLGRERVLEGLLALSRLRGTIVQWPAATPCNPALDTSPRPVNHTSLSKGGCVMDVASWLRSLGLEQYEAAFPRERDRRTASCPI